MSMTKVNEKLKGSLLGTNEVADFVDAIYEGFEELKDGFQITDLIDLGNVAIKAYTNNKVAIAQIFDLQDNEIVDLIDRSNNFELAELAQEARQIVKFILVGFQTYSVFTGKLG